MEWVWGGIAVLLFIVAIYKFLKAAKDRFGLRLFVSPSYAVLVLGVLIFFTIGDYYSVSEQQAPEASYSPLIWMAVSLSSAVILALFLNIKKSDFLWGAGFTIVQIIMTVFALAILLGYFLLWALNADRKRNLRTEQ